MDSDHVLTHIISPRCQDCPIRPNQWVVSPSALVMVRDLQNYAVVIARKRETAVRIFRTQGVRGLASATFRRLNPRLHFREWRSKDHWWVGRLVEFMGNVVRIDGCSFTVDSPYIATVNKSRFLLGYEAPERYALEHFVDPDLPVVELGASVGVVACLTNKRLRRPDRHVVVEAHPGILPVLERNRERNGCAFTIVYGAIAYGIDQVTFYTPGYFLGAGLYVDGPCPSVSVPAVSLEQIIERFGFDRCMLISDIEGAESELIKHEVSILRDRVVTIILETHDWYLPHTAGCTAVLERAGFCRLATFGRTDVYRNEMLSKSANADERGPVLAD